MSVNPAATAISQEVAERIQKTLGMLQIALTEKTVLLEAANIALQQKAAEVDALKAKYEPDTPPEGGETRGAD